MAVTPKLAKSIFHFFKISWIISILILVALIFVVFLRYSEISQFIQLLTKAKPKWLIIAVLLQIGTYGCAALIWHSILKPAGHKLKLRVLARFSIEKLSINQLIPTGGVAGNFVVLKAMQHLGLPTWLATEALLIDILTHYFVYSILAILAILFLWWHNNITIVMLSLVGILVFIAIFVPLIIIFLLRSRLWHAPRWLKQTKLFSRIYLIFEQLKPRRHLRWSVLIKVSIFQIFIFILDTSTFWFIMKSLGTPISLLTAGVSLIIAIIAGIASFLPGSIGSFETGSVAILVILGTPIEAALVGTMLMRGLTLWLVLIPGVLFSRRDLILSKKRLPSS